MNNSPWRSVGAQCAGLTTYGRLSDVGFSRMSIKNLRLYINNTVLHSIATKVFSTMASSCLYGLRLALVVSTHDG